MTLAYPGVRGHSKPSRWLAAQLSIAGRLRLALFAGAGVFATAAAMAGSPEAMQAADPELAFLLRGMALLKAAMVLAALGILSWRFSATFTPPIAAGYLASVWTGAAAAMLIWQLSYLVVASVMFHAATLILLFLAWRDQRYLRTTGNDRSHTSRHA